MGSGNSILKPLSPLVGVLKSKTSLVRLPNLIYSGGGGKMEELEEPSPPPFPLLPFFTAVNNFPFGEIKTLEPGDTCSLELEKSIPRERLSKKNSQNCPYCLLIHYLMRLRSFPDHNLRWTTQLPVEGTTHLGAASVGLGLLILKKTIKASISKTFRKNFVLTLCKQIKFIKVT